ncbi:MAG TPA: calcium-binding protein, partial [Parvularculaceae bacterium]|nr:calcium-binding protein [Parvularculaceae bacterium]HRX40808.1 calcium-binding protein [Parvularculaceae bacterium]
MSLSDLNLLSQSAYFSLLYDMIKQRENPWLYAGTGYDGIHNGGGDGNPTFGYGFNLFAFSASIVEQVILHAYNNSLTSQQSDGLDLILDWKTGASVWIDGQSRALTNADILNLADESLNGAPGAIGSSAQRAAVQSLTLTDAQASRMLDVMIKGDLNLVHIEGPAGSYGYEDGLDYRLAEEGSPAFSTERAALLSVYYNAPSLIGPGVQNAIANDDRAQLWYEIRYNHNHYDSNGLQSRRAEESDLLGLVSHAAKASPSAHIEEYAAVLDTLFNDDDRLGNRILTRIEARDALDDFQAAIAPELQALLDYYVLQPLGATSAPTIEYVQAATNNISSQMIASSLGEAGVPGGEGPATTVNLIVGGGGNDLIMGLGAADYLYGGAGADTIYGEGAGTPSSQAGHDLIDGGEGNDSLYGGYGDEYINGGDGADTIFGDAGADNLDGGGDNDLINAGSGNDYVS